MVAHACETHTHTHTPSHSRSCLPVGMINYSSAPPSLFSFFISSLLVRPLSLLVALCQNMTVDVTPIPPPPPRTHTPTHTHHHTHIHTITHPSPSTTSLPLFFTSSNKLNPSPPPWCRWCQFVSQQSLLVCLLTQQHNDSLCLFVSTGGASRGFSLSRGRTHSPSVVRAEHYWLRSVTLLAFQPVSLLACQPERERDLRAGVCGVCILL